MLRVGGFNEFSPKQQLIFDDVIKIVKKNYSSFGFTPLETPAVERNEVLTSKSGEDASKQIFGLYGLAQGSEDTKEYSLRFDLTVPFARYVLDWENNLVFPFKRYQIQPVWRGERQQRGRYKQFYQADIDIIWRGDDERSYIYYDSEVIFALYKTLNEILEYLKMDDIAIVNINNRKVLFGLINGLMGNDEDLRYKIFNLVDKFYKIGNEKFLSELRLIGLSGDIVDKIFEFVTKDVNLLNLLDLRGFVDDKLFEEGIDELYKTCRLIEQFSVSSGINVNYNINFLIVRGLDYYTGSVFETFLKNNRDLGSICSGGRYEKLTTYINPKSNFSGVGGSIGVDRFMTALFEKDFDIQKKNITEYLFLNFEDTFNDIVNLSMKFMGEGKNIEIYPEPVKLKKQFEYADKKGINNVIILGSGELQNGRYKIKDLITGQESEFDL